MASQRVLHAFLIVAISMLGQSFSQLADTTVLDGIKQPYNQYIKFSGSQGIQAAISYSGVTSYTFSIWIKLDAYPWDIKNDFNIFTCSPDCFTLTLTRSTKAIRAIGSRSGYLTIDGNIKLYNWYIIVIKSNSTNSVLQLRDLSYKQLNYDSQSQFFPQGISSLSFSSIMIGINSDRSSNGFQGSIRNLKLFQGILTDSQAYRIQFIYVVPRREQLLQIIMETVEGLKNEGDRATFTLIQKNGGLVNSVDFLGNYNCSEIPTAKPIAFLKLGKQTTLSTQVFTSDQISSTNYNTSLQMWVKRIQVPVSIVNDPTEVLFNHEGTSKLSFTINDNTNMLIQGRQAGIQTTLRFPHNRWMFLQMSSTSSQISVTLYDDENVFESTATLSYTSTQTSISRSMIIAQNFNGLIFGVKIYKQAFPVTLGPHSFTYSIEQSQNALIYFMLQKTGQSSVAFEFWNLVQYNSQRKIIATGQKLFVNEPMINSSYTYTLGNKDGPVVFDGYACIDNREKAYMADDQSYLSSSFSTNKSLIEYTIEFWAKRQQSVSGSAFYFALAYSDNSDQVYPAIIQNSGKLVCYPFFKLDRSISVTYSEYVSNINKNQLYWIHVSCTFDSTNSWIIGQLLQSSDDYLYKSSYQSTTLISLPKQSYVLYMNTNPATKDNGFSQIFYAEVRFWSYARSQSQIRYQRLMRLNTSAEMQYLYSYLKLGYANYNGTVNEIDYADYSLDRLVQLTSVQWKSNTDLLICPEGYSRGFKDSQCYKDSLKELSLSVYKRNNNEFVVTPVFSTFRTAYYKDKFTQLYEFSWSLTSTTTKNNTNTQLFPKYFNPQSSKAELVFSYDQVTDAPGRYSFKLSMIDQAYLQDALTASITLAAKQCANIFDAETGLSFVLKDMNNNKNSQDSILKYNYTECFDYVFDSSSLQFGIDLDGVSMSSSDHNSKAQTIRIRDTLQASIPANEYFFVRATGTWRNPNNKNDILQYSVLYGCRYIAKLVLSLSTNYQIATKGNTVLVTYSAIVANLNTDSSSQRSFTLYWTCPSKIQSICNQFNNTNLQLYYDQIVNSGLNLFQPQTIYLNGITNFVQGDSSNTAQASIIITWIDVTPDGDLSLLTPIPTTNQDVAFQFSVTSMTENQIDLLWSLTPSVSNGCLVNANNRKQYVIQGSCLKLGTQYSVKVTLSYKGVSSSELNSRSMNFQLRSLPTGGSFTCNTTSGLAVFTFVSCTAKSWTGESQPLLYQYLAQDLFGRIQAVSPMTIQQTAVFRAIPSTRVILRVYDGDYKFSSQQITVNFQQTDYSNSTWSQMTNLLSTVASSGQAGSLTSQSNVEFVKALQSIAVYLNMNQAKIPSPQALQAFQQLINGAASQYESIQKFENSDQVNYFIQGCVQAFSQISNYTQALDLSSFNQMQAIVLGSINQFPLIFASICQDQDFLKNLFQMQSNILKTLTLAQQSNGFYSFSNNEQKLSTNITAQLRQILSVSEQTISQSLYEGEVYEYQNPVFNISITKYSRSGNILYDYGAQSNSFLNYSFPLSSALQPTDRQTFTVISFDYSPFIGSFFKNQSALVNTSVYFAYRDQNGKYLNAENVLGQIYMKFAYPDAKLNNPYNKTVCGYIGSSDTQWENSSCSTTFDTQDGYVVCSCNHMSYYSVIDDSLVREHNVVQLGFVNWVSLIPFGYMLIVFIIGLIYTYAKDNSDFQQLNLQDKTLGHDLMDGNSVTIKTLLFKRKVFYTGFGSKFSSCTLFRILFMKLHPLYQLKYSFNPELPRFYKFIVLYTRLMIMLALCFFVLRDFHDFEQVFDLQNLDAVILIKFLVIIILGGILFIPLPGFIYRCMRSRYFLIRQKERLSFVSEDDKHFISQTVNMRSHRSPQDKNGPMEENLNSQEQLHDYDSISNTAKKHIQPQQQFEQERFTNVLIDTNLPIKLMFLLDRASTDKIIREYPTTMNYSSGNAKTLGKKLLELDDEIYTNKKVVQSNTHHQRYMHHPQISERQLYPIKDTSQRNTENELSDATTNRKLQPNLTPKKMKQFEERDLQESQPIPTYAQDMNDADSKDKFSASLSAVNRNSQSVKSQKPLSSLNMPELGFGDRGQENYAVVINPSEVDCELRDEEEDYEGGEKEQSPSQNQDDANQEPTRVKKVKEVINTNLDDDEEIKEDEEAHDLSLNQIQPSQNIKLRGLNNPINQGQPNKLIMNPGLQQQIMIPKIIQPVYPEYQDNSHFNEYQSYGPYLMNPNMTDNEFVIQNVSKSGTDIMESYIGSLESQLDADEKKELVEQKNYCGRLFSNVLSLILNLGILVVIFYFYVTEEFYLEENNYVWVVVFFCTQLLGFLIFDTIAIAIITCAVNKGCCKKRKDLQLRWMREALYIYEDYRYIMNYVETKIE